MFSCSPRAGLFRRSMSIAPRWFFVSIVLGPRQQHGIKASKTSASKLRATEPMEWLRTALAKEFDKIVQKFLYEILAAVEDELDEYEVFRVMLSQPVAISGVYNLQVVARFFLYALLTPTLHHILIHIHPTPTPTMHGFCFSLCDNLARVLCLKLTHISSTGLCFGRLMFPPRLRLADFRVCLFGHR